jgi:hypothetical protein
MLKKEKPKGGLLMLFVKGVVPIHNIFEYVLRIKGHLHSIHISCWNNFINVLKILDNVFLNSLNNSLH